LKLWSSPNLKDSINARIDTLLKDNTPKLLLFPVTLRCNSRCVMCNIWQADHTSELSFCEIVKLLKDPSLKKIEYLIITGGEPTLRGDLVQIAQLFIDNCSKLQSIQLATNGFNTKKVVADCTEIARICLQSKVTFSILVSLDGLGDVHDRVRQTPGAFEKVRATIDSLLAIKSDLNFGLHVNCVLTRYNIRELNDLIDWCEKKRIHLDYQLAHDWQRFKNAEHDFSLSEEETSFYLNLLWNKIKGSKGSFYDWMIYRMVRKGCGRPVGCSNLINAFSISPNGSVYYCPNACSIGNIHQNSFTDIYYSAKNLEYRKKVVSQKCKKCIQSCWIDNSFDNNLLNKLRYKTIRRLMVKHR
jgi:MoaA/NifB/PqqE/SkfB family radical SAM enzyme